MAEWHFALSEEDRAKKVADAAGWRDPATAGQRMAASGASYRAADADGDGRLNPAEFKDFMLRECQSVVDRGVPQQDMAAMSDDAWSTLY